MTREAKTQARRVSTARAERRRAARQKARPGATRRTPRWQGVLAIGLLISLMLGAVGWGAWQYVDERWLSGRKALVMVGEDPITAGDLDRRARVWDFLQWGRPGREELLEELIDERLVLREAALRGLEPSAATVSDQVDTLLSSLEPLYENAAGVRRAMQAARVRRSDLEAMVRFWIAAQSYFEETVGGVTVDDAEVMAYYEQHLGEFRTPRQVTVRHILVAGEQEALEVLSLLEEGEDFAALAAARSLDPGTRDRGGLLPWPVAAGDQRLSAEFVAAALELPEGGLSHPVKTEYGYHIIRADAVTAERQRPYEEVEEEIREKLLAQRRMEAFQALLDELRERVGVRYLTD